MLLRGHLCKVSRATQSTCRKRQSSVTREVTLSPEGFLRNECPLVGISLQDMGSSLSVTILNAPSLLLFPRLLVTSLPSSHCLRIRSEHQAISPSMDWTTSGLLEVCALTFLTIPQGLGYSSHQLSRHRCAVMTYLEARKTRSLLH